MKFVPTPEEAQLLAEHAQDMEQMARADKFLFEAGRYILLCSCRKYMLRR